MTASGAPGLRWSAPAAWAVDLALLLVFVAIGRAGHGEDASGYALTLLPFLVGWRLLAVLVLRLTRRPAPVSAAAE